MAQPIDTGGLPPGMPQPGAAEAAAPGAEPGMVEAAQDEIINAIRTLIDFTNAQEQRGNPQAPQLKQLIQQFVQTLSGGGQMQEMEQAAQAGMQTRTGGQTQPIPEGQAAGAVPVL